jgi:hypothetical protein
MITEKLTKTFLIKVDITIMENKAICITLGEQSENPVGMIKYGNGLCEKGYSVEEIVEMRKKFEEKGCKCVLLNLNNLLEGEKCEEKASVLVIRNCVDGLLGEGKNKEMRGLYNA